MDLVMAKTPWCAGTDSLNSAGLRAPFFAKAKIAMTVSTETRSPLGRWMSREGPPSRIRLRTLVLIRWVAVAGQTATILLVHYGFGLKVALEPTLGAVAVSAVLNAFLTLLWPRATRVGDLGGAVLLGYDILQLAVLLALTGGLHNPFSLLMLVPVTISATFLNLRSTAALCLLAVVCSTVIAVFHLPLPSEDGSIDLPRLYTLGIWIALVLGIVFVASYAWRVAEESRRMADALSATQLALAQEQRVSAVGALAAAAAHDLGTPLATISVVVKELARDLSADSPLADDIKLLQSEAARCREILAQLPRRGAAAGVAPVAALPVSALVHSIAEARQREGVALEIRAAPEETAPDSPQPVLPYRAEIIHGLGNLIDNAMHFAEARVELRIRWNESQILLEILDDGPGFNPGVLNLLGEPYLTRRKDQGGMGLGVFIAKTLLNRTGAVLGFSNRRAGGAYVTVSWQRKAIEVPREHGPGRDLVPGIETQSEE